MEKQTLPSNEDDDEPKSSPVMQVKAAAGFVSELCEFAIACDKPNLLGLIKSQTIVNEIKWERLKEAKQIKITNFLRKSCFMHMYCIMCFIDILLK